MEKQKLNPTIVYVLSSLGLLCCCIAGIGIIPSGISYYLAVNKLKKVKESPEDYEGSNIKSMNTAKIFALVILIINALMVIRVIYVVITGGIDEIYNEFTRGYQQAIENQGQQLVDIPALLFGEINNANQGLKTKFDYQSFINILLTYFENLKIQITDNQICKKHNL